MNAVEGASQIIILVQQAVPLMVRLVALARRLGHPRFSYENLLLDFTMEIADERTRSARVLRRQRARFLSQEAGVVRYPLWGEGDHVQKLTLKGARRLGVSREGPRTVLLWGLLRPANIGEVVEIRSEERLQGVLQAGHEYFEMAVERPTRRLVAKVIFPAGSGPVDPHIAMGARTKRLPVRLGRDGRQRVQFTAKKPALGTTYSIRWSW